MHVKILSGKRTGQVRKVDRDYSRAEAETDVATGFAQWYTPPAAAETATPETASTAPQARPATPDKETDIPDGPRVAEAAGRGWYILTDGSKKQLSQAAARGLGWEG